MVHVSTQLDGTNKTAVVGILYKYGSPDPLLSKVRTCNNVYNKIKEQKKKTKHAASYLSILHV